MQRPTGSAPVRLATSFALAIGLAVALAGCAQPRSGDPETTGSIGLAPERGPVGSAAEWTERYKASPDDPAVAMSFARALRAEGRAAQAVDVLQRTMVQRQNDPVVASAYGKALAEKGDFDAALKVIRAANSPRTPDWRLTSAEGAVLDQMGNPQEARRLYEVALKLAPEEPTVLNNYGLSFTLTNELPQAEQILRRAAASPAADGRIRQNLALVVGLQGRFDEARRIATEALPKDQADANVAYLKAMLSQPNTWKQIEKTGRTG
ncbi:MAG: tetratricopeptide repeat protein [Hyphomicrobiales bacterium]|nr:tetratricopeptide repeat protein [Hyphomicrobiales bacterium]